MRQVLVPLAGPLLVEILLGSVGPNPALALDTFPAQWVSAYPTSQSDDNVANGTGAPCQLCHASVAGGPGWNAYGWDVLAEIRLGSQPVDAFLAAAPPDSDLDPSGSANSFEIGAGTQPGWTNGPNNTIYFEGQSPLTNQSPPALILGELDPPPAPLPASGFVGQLLLALVLVAGGTRALMRRCSDVTTL